MRSRLLHQFADEGIDLLQTERGLRTAFQIAAHEAVFHNAYLQRGSTSLIGGAAPYFFAKASTPRMRRTPISPC